ncbi:MAG: Fe-S cluster assembly ATPase SufC [Lachnospiraceae bacterium]|nr:Fe-S cluster assembly ATPase SufC [Lachnospiraceae bacterium]
MALLEIKGLNVSVEDNEILQDINLSIGKGEIHVLMGHNGAGKSTLGNALMGNPAYRITKGNIFFNGLDIKDEPADKRAKAGMFMSFQNPLEVPGITLSAFIRNAIIQKTGERIKLTEFRKNLADNMALLHFDSSYKDRDLNVGFSGGEKKKAEILQLLMLKPRFAILDETDSGLDVDAVRTVSEGIREYMSDDSRSERALLIITHSTKILESLQVDRTHILVHGRIVKSGDGSLVDEINQNGFEQYM